MSVDCFLLIVALGVIVIAQFCIGVQSDRQFRNLLKTAEEMLIALKKTQMESKTK